jgi:hypothetical protein
VLGDNGEMTAGLWDLGAKRGSVLGSGPDGHLKGQLAGNGLAASATLRGAR